MKHNEHGQLVQFSKSWDKATEIYQAPEIWLRHPFNPFWSDAWALGVLLFKLLNEDYPVDVKKPFNSMIVSNSITLASNVRHHINFDHWLTLFGCLIDRHGRPKVSVHS